MASSCSSFQGQSSGTVKLSYSSIILVLDSYRKLVTATDFNLKSILLNEKIYNSI